MNPFSSTKKHDSLNVNLDEDFGPKGSKSGRKSQIWKWGLVKGDLEKTQLASTIEDRVLS